jgi:hypothetical protein
MYIAAAVNVKERLIPTSYTGILPLPHVASIAVAPSLSTSISGDEPLFLDDLRVLGPSVDALRERDLLLSPLEREACGQVPVHQLQLGLFRESAYLSYHR